ncbi:MAG: hypothetical protein EOO43_20765, partial [Flavobacterium sp.]
MKYPIRRLWPYIIIMLGGVVFLIWLGYRSKIDNGILLGGIATLITLFLTVVNYYQSNDKFFKELFIEFNKRYDGMNNFLNSLPNDSIILTNDDKQKVIDYLVLCSEEYIWV